MPNLSLFVTREIRAAMRLYFDPLWKLSQHWRWVRGFWSEVPKLARSPWDVAFLIVFALVGGFTLGVVWLSFYNRNEAQAWATEKAVLLQQIEQLTREESATGTVREEKNPELYDSTQNLHVKGFLFTLRGCVREHTYTMRCELRITNPTASSKSLSVDSASIFDVKGDRYEISAVITEGFSVVSYPQIDITPKTVLPTKVFFSEIPAQVPVQGIRALEIDLTSGGVRFPIKFSLMPSGQ